MKRIYPVLILSLISLGAISSGCSSSQPANPNTVQLNKDKPTVLNARSEPETIVMNSDMQPVAPVTVIADVKDFSAAVTDVHLKFDTVPLDVPMERMGTSTNWKADLTPQQLQMLAISGQTVKYKTSIVARNADGKSATSTQPLYLSVKAPEASHYG